MKRKVNKITCFVMVIIMLSVSGILAYLANASSRTIAKADDIIIDNTTIINDPTVINDTTIITDPTIIIDKSKTSYKEKISFKLKYKETNSYVNNIYYIETPEAKEKRLEKEKQNKILKNRKEAAKKVGAVGLELLSTLLQEDPNWANFSFEATKLLCEGLASFLGLGGIVSGIFSFIDSLLPGAKPLSETALLSNKMSEEFDKVHSQLSDIEKEIALLSATVKEESDRVISQISAEMNALDARQYVRTFTFSGEGNFSYNQFYNYLYGSTDPDNVYYTQAYYNALLEAIASNSSDETIRCCFDDLYSALMSTAATGQSNYVMLYEYLTNEKSIAQYYYDYILSNPELLKNGENASYLAIEYAKEKYITEIFAGSLIEICNMYQMNSLMEQYGRELRNDVKYCYNKMTNESVTYAQIRKNVDYIENNKETLLKKLIQDIALISGMGESYLVEESSGQIYWVSNSNESTFGQVVPGQKIYLNQMAQSLIEGLECESNDFYFVINNVRTQNPYFEVGNTNVRVEAYYKDVILYSINFIPGTTTTFNGGDGSDILPYNISNLSQLYLVSNDLSAHYRLIMDVDCANATFNGFGSADNTFEGVFDGNGCSIQNLKISSAYQSDTTKPLCVGLFNSIGSKGCVKDLTLSNITVESLEDTDKFQLATVSSVNDFYIGIITGYNKGSIDNCSVQNSSVDTVRNNKTVNRIITVVTGGIAGRNDGVISRCSMSNGSIQTSSRHEYAAEPDSKNANSVYVGGIAGDSYGLLKDCRVDNKTTIGKVLAESYTNVKKTTSYPRINLYIGGIAGKGNSERMINVYSQAIIDNYKIERGNNGGAAWTSGEYCVLKTDQYVPYEKDSEKVTGASSYNSVNVPGKTIHKADMAYDKIEKNGTISLEKENLIVMIDGSKRSDYEIIGFYGLGARNKNLDSTLDIDVVAVITCTIDEEEYILSDTFTVRLDKNEISKITVERLDGTFDYGNTQPVATFAYLNVYYTSGEVELLEVLDMPLNFIGEQTNLQYGSNELQLTYKGNVINCDLNVQCLHNYKTETVEATCAHAGYNKKVCTLCGEEEIISRTEKLTRHSLILIEEAVEPTCTKDGSTGKVYCKECGFVLVEESIIPKTAHTYIKSDVTEHVCAICNKVEAHQYIVSESINEDGNIVYVHKCLNCQDGYTQVDTNTITEEINSLPTVVVSDGYALNGGDLVTVYVQLLNNPGVTGANFGIRYDERLTLVRWEEGTVLSQTVGANNEVNCGWNFLWGNADVSYKNGTMLSLTFRVPYDAKLSDAYQVYVVYGLIRFTEGGFSLDDGSTTPKKFITKSGMISVVEQLPGDTNGDGVVDLLDSVYLARFLVGRVDNIKQKQADINLDGQVNLNDVVDSLRGLIGGYGVNFLNQEYEIVLDTNGADVGYDNLKVSLYGENNKYVLESPSRIGYKFLGWYTRIYGEGGTLVENGDLVKYDRNQSKQTLYARWSPNSVEFDMNGATSAALETIVYSTNVTACTLSLPEKDFTVKMLYGNELLCYKDFHYTFLGWEDVVGRIYKSRYEFDLTTPDMGTVVLKAVWSVIYVTDGLVPDRPGYEFGGYFVNQTGIERLVLNDGTFDSAAMDAWVSSTTEDNRTLFASFEPKRCKITLDPLGGSVERETFTVTYDRSYTTLPIATREGYTFGGWFFGDKQISYPSGNIVVENDYFDEEYRSRCENDMTVTAKWTPNVYTVSFDPVETSNTVSGSLNDVQITFDQEYGNLPVLTKIGYDFDGWYTSKRGGTQIESTTKLYIANNHVLYAQWIAKKYTVTFDASTNGGTCELQTKEVTFGDVYGDLPEASKEGYQFTGWSLNGKPINCDVYVSTAADHTLIAIFAADWCKVTFDANGGIFEDGQETRVQNFAYEEPYGLLPSVLRILRAGYTCLGWFTETSGGTKVGNETIVNVIGTQTLYAQWELNNHIITLDFNSVFDGKDDEVSCEKDSFTIHYDDLYTALPSTATRTGYTFQGWYTERVGGTKVKASDKHTKEEDITLFAHWKEKKYSITFESHNANNATNTIEINYRSNVTIPTYASYPGYDIEGWYTKENGGVCVIDKNGALSGPYFDNKGRWIYDGNTTLHGQWDEHEYEIIFEPHGGTCSTTLSKIKYKEKYGSAGGLPNATRTGYTLKGWYTAASGGSKIENDTIMDKTVDHTIHAQWTADKYVVSFDANGGSCSTASTTVTYGATYGSGTAGSLPNAARAGYTLKGWYTAVSGGRKIENGTIMNKTIDHMLYAQWTANEYVVSFDANGGSCSTASTTVTYGATYGSGTAGNLPNAARAGHALTGWYTVKSGGTKIENNTIVEITSNITLYAQWKEETYKVTFNANGGSCSTETKQVTFGATYGTLPDPKWYLDDYDISFDGWYTTITGGSKVTESSSVMITSDQVLYAHWSKVKIKSTVIFDTSISYDNNGWRDREITDAGVTTEIVYPGLDRKVLKDMGYTKIYVTINFDCCESEDGYQDIKVYSHEDKEVHSASLEHSHGKTDTSWKTLTTTCYISLNDVQTDGSFWVKWGAHGKGKDIWRLGATTYTIVAIK